MTPIVFEDEDQGPPLLVSSWIFQVFAQTLYGRKFLWHHFTCWSLCLYYWDSLAAASAALSIYWSFLSSLLPLSHWLTAVCRALKFQTEKWQPFFSSRPLL